MHYDKHFKELVKSVANQGVANQDKRFFFFFQDLLNA